VNAAEPHHRPFLDETVPLARSKGLGIVGMKVLRGFIFGNGQGTELHPELLAHRVTVAHLLRFAFSQPVSTAIVGCETIEQLEENVAVARVAKPMDDSEREHLLERTRPYARTALSYKAGVPW
jgi:aryl-alcohol dehydrogenase-like predicted oxidoreductase